jgi:hypothetical protein
MAAWQQVAMHLLCATRVVQPPRPSRQTAGVLVPPADTPLLLLLSLASL